MRRSRYHDPVLTTLDADLRAMIPARLISSHSRNLGDEIQSIAAAQFLPEAEVSIDRDRLDRASSWGPVVAIFAGWFLHSFSPWPPPANLRPIYLGFHAAAPARILNPKGLQHLIRFAPIGCRDPSTVEILRSHGIPAYWSGCATLTLPRASALIRTEAIIACDVEEEFLSALVPVELQSIVRSVSHRVPPRKRGSTEWKRTEARRRLALYESASLVITTRLHAALPCIAFRTPVVVIRTPEVMRSPRWSGWRDLVGTLDPAERPPWARVLNLGQRSITSSPFPTIRSDFSAVVKSVLPRHEPCIS